MTRIVCSQKGAARARVKVVSRQITVRYRPSDKFIQKVKKGRESAENDVIEPLGESAARALGGPLGLDGPEHRGAAPVPPEKGLQLPRLRAYLEQASDPPPRPDGDQPAETGDLNAIRDRVRRPEMARRSSYEELRARWRQK